MKLKGKNVRNVAVASLFGAGLLGLLVAPIIASEMSFATDCTGPGCLNIEVTVPPYISITGATALADLGEAASDTVSVSSAQTVTVATNQVGGYYLTAKAISEDTTGAVSNKLLRRNHESDTESTDTLSNVGFNSLTAKTVKTSMGAGYWGLSLDNVTYRPIATTTSGSGIIAYSKVPIAPATTTLYYGAKYSSELLQGDYSATIQYTALVNDGTDRTIYGD